MEITLPIDNTPKAVEDMYTVRMRIYAISVANNYQAKALFTNKIFAVQSPSHQDLGMGRIGKNR